MSTFKTSANDKAKLGEEALAKPDFIRAQATRKNEAAILRASVAAMNMISGDDVAVLQTSMAGWATAHTGGSAFKAASPTKAVSQAVSSRASVAAESEIV